MFERCLILRSFPHTGPASGRREYRLQRESSFYLYFNNSWLWAPACAGVSGDLK